MKKKAAVRPNGQNSSKPKETKVEAIAAYAVLAVTLLFIITFNLQAFAIPSGSMENTLLIGDHVFVNRISLAPKTSWMPLMPYREIRRGDIIVFYKPGEPGLHLVKRTIGVPGDHIRLRQGVVYVNGKAQAEPYVIHSLGNYDAYRDDFPAASASDYEPMTPKWRAELPQHVENEELVVPADSYFAMGDNRDNSLDSRYWGFVPRENVIGTPMFIYWSFQTPAGEYLKTDMSDRIKSAANVVLHFVDETRWGRMLHVVR